MTVELSIVDFDRVVQNLLLYTDKKAIRLREVFFMVEGNTLYGFACDDYVAVSDTLVFEGEPVKKEFTMSIEDLELLGEWIKKDKKVVHKQKAKLTFFNTYIKTKDEEGNVEKFKISHDNQDAWDLVFDMLDIEQELQMILDVTLRPERVAKLARLKADKEAPLAFRGIDFRGSLLLQFKKGYTILGVLMPVKNEFVIEEFLWSPNNHTDPLANSISTDSAASPTD